MVTIKDVAKKAGVSVATVSAVINKDSDVNVSDRLSKKVTSAVDELNYRPNRIARALSKKENPMIAYVVPTIRNEFFSQIGHYIENFAFEKKYGVYLCNTHSKIERSDLYLNNLIENRVSGVIVTLTWEIMTSNFIENLLEANIPVVGMAGARKRDDIDTVLIDDKEGSFKAVEYLIKSNKTNVAFIGVEESKTTEIRYSGYKKAFRKYNLELNKDLISIQKDFDRENGYQAAASLIENNGSIDAIFVYNDVMASGVIDYLNHKKIKIPNEIAVIGYDNSVASYTNPKLTTVALPKFKMAENSMQLLFDRIQNNSKDNFKKILIHPELIIRETT
jgi:DNA-binding LacI/PurR family transcriptional regulator